MGVLPSIYVSASPLDFALAAFEQFPVSLHAPSVRRVVACLAYTQFSGDRSGSSNSSTGAFFGLSLLSSAAILAADWLGIGTHRSRQYSENPSGRNVQLLCHLRFLV